MATELSLPFVIGASLIDGINPCAFGVLIFLLSYLLKKTHDMKRMLLDGTIYIFGVFITYMVAGLVLLPIIQHLGNFSVYAYIIIGIAIIIFGLLELKDFFWYGKGPSLQILPGYAQKIKDIAEKLGGKGKQSAMLSGSISFVLGVVVALVELPCTGAVYLAVLTLMSINGFTALNMSYLVLYNIIFVLPLFIIMFLVYKGLSTQAMEAWRNANKKYMRLIVGLLLTGVGIWMLLYIT
ncbi:GAP family protein [Candidatus Woesearchaeota archaeon]|nr:GAP family protein [Candidatus Woesearchaeota archaeon]